MLRHFATTMREAKHDMMFITEVRCASRLAVKNLHMVCAEEFLTRGQVGIFLTGAVNKRWEAGGCIWTSDGDEGRWR